MDTTSIHSHFASFLAVLAIFSSGADVARAQISTSGSDPASIRWNVIRSDNYKLLYPRGLDSLANAYLVELEHWRDRVAATSGYAPGQQYRRPTPVILHAYGSNANGAVTWAPRRMDLFTYPGLNDPEPMPWMRNLAVHESRHVGQMQFGRSGFFKGFHYVFGELFAGAAAGIYPSTAFLEGDAVTAETELTGAGRGRSDSFLRQYRISLADGDSRNWWQWRYGSQKKYTPDYYAAGYFAISGARYAFDTPHFTDHYFNRILRRGGFAFWNWQKTFKELSGEEKFKDAFAKVSETYAGVWEEYDKSRDTDSLPETRLTKAGRFHAEYSNMAAAPDGVYVIKTSMDKATELHFIDKDGKDTFVRPMTSKIGRLAFHDGRLYWSENVSDLRWELGGTSRIRYIRHHGRKAHNLNTKGRLVNPSFDGDILLAIDCREDGSYAIHNGPAAPEGVELTEVAGGGKEILAIGLSNDGLGLYRHDGSWKAVLKPSKVRMHTLRVQDGAIYFVSDLDGTDEIYCLKEDSLLKLTNYRFGASDYCLYDGKIILSLPGTDGNHLYCENIEGLNPKNADWEDVYVSPVVKKLVSQADGILAATPLDKEVKISEPKKYNKLAGIPHFHSWAPFYFEYDEIDGLSFEESSEALKSGASAMFQNLLGTAWGMVGLGVQQNTKNDDLRPIGYASISWKGWYPVFSASLRFNERDACGYTRYRVTSDGTIWNAVNYNDQDKAYYEASLIAYIPFNLSSGGWNRGLIPQVNVKLTNDSFDKSIYYVTYAPGASVGTLTKTEAGKTINQNLIITSLRGYTMRPVPNSGIYPRWGIGAEAGYRFRPGLSDVFTPGFYAYGYGYLPGLLSTHGIRLSAIWQHLDSGLMYENTVTTRPRGFKGSGINSYLALHQQNQFKATIDYAMPVLPVDWGGLSPFLYIRN
nr:hypothetical protein [Bacteroidales bacterium]